MNGDHNKYPSLSHFTDKLLLYGKGWKGMLFLPNQSINIMYPNVNNMIVVPITKQLEIIMSIQVCLISRIKFYFKENGGKKRFSS